MICEMNRQIHKKEYCYDEENIFYYDSDIGPDYYVGGYVRNVEIAYYDEYNLE